MNTDVSVGSSPSNAEPRARDVLFVAGEASGDLHGSRLARHLSKLGAPLRLFGLGGAELRSAGIELVAESSEISVVGLFEALRLIPRARRIFHRLLREVDRRRASAAVLIDFPDFNLRLAKQLKRRNVTIVYYISPQIWAWRSGRVKSIARFVDRLLVVLPFEVEFYRQHGVEAVHVGHPLVDEIPDLPQAWERPHPATAPYRVALLPGSRLSEISSNLPSMLEAVEILAQQLPIRVSLIKAATVEENQLASHLADSDLAIELVTDSRYQAIADSHLAICASGTATLEAGLLGTPMIVVYRMNAWTYRLGRRLVKLENISLVNLVLGKRVVPELIQHEARPSAISELAAAILGNHDRILEMRSELGRLRGQLGTKGASMRAAQQVLEALGNTPGQSPGRGPK